jgi:hypothetical protein
MKKLVVLLCFTFILYSIYAQNNTQLNSSTLQYAPEVPKTETYKVLKNELNKEIDADILKQINYHRRLEEDFVWIVNENIEILILSMSKLKDLQKD